MSSMRYTGRGCSLLDLQTPGQREIRRRPARDFSLHRPLASAAAQEEVPPIV